MFASILKSEICEKSYLVHGMTKSVIPIIKNYVSF